MKQYIDKDTLVTEIKRLIDRSEYSEVYDYAFRDGNNAVCTYILNFLNNIEVKDVDTWHLQEKEDIYDAVKDWGTYTFACIMKDGTIQKFIGNLDIDYEGYISIHIHRVNDDYDDVDDIVKWIEYT